MPRSEFSEERTPIPLNRKMCKNQPLSASQVPAMKTRRLAPEIFLLLLALALLCPPVFAKTKTKERPPLNPKILAAKSIYLDCDCRKEMAVSLASALPELLDWGRYQLVPDREHADLVLFFSMNPYQGDYLTRDGPDKRPAIVDYTILTVIDAHTGEALWTDWKRWGYMLVSYASRSLIHDLRLTVAQEVKSWTLDDVLRCSNSAAYTAFANLTPEEALTKSGADAVHEKDGAHQFTIGAPGAPDFCRRAHLAVSPENKILGFEVLPAGAETLDLAELMQQADQFDFSGGKDATTGEPFFTAEAKSKKIVIQYTLQGRMPRLVNVKYLY